MSSDNISAVQPPYEDGIFECSINDLIHNHSLVLCNQRGDSLFYFDEHEGKPVFLASPVESKHRTAIKNWQKTIRWRDYSYETGFEQDFIIPRSRVRRACRILGLNLIHIKRTLSQEAKDRLVNMGFKSKARIV